MYERLDDTGPPISRLDISALEHRLGFSLPSDYADFLLRHNGGSPKPDAVPVQEWPNGGPEADVRMLYCLGPDPAEDTYDLRWNLEVMAGRIPPGLLPIAATSCGDDFCIWLTGVERGAVVLWDHEAEHRPPTTANLHSVAPSFTAFLELLMDFSAD